MRLYLLHLGRILPYGAPIPGYLIQTGDGANVLVDTGLPHSFIENPPQIPGVQFEMQPEDWIVHRLAEVGLEPRNINYLICTHLDADHDGNNDLFTESEIVVQRANYELARSGHPRFAIIRPHWDALNLRYRMVDGDTDLMPGIRLIETGGHVPGHQSVLLDLPDYGKTLLAIDAVPHHLMSNPDTRAIDFADMDADATRASTRKLADLTDDYHDAFVIFGHDAEKWEKLRKSPDFYT